MNEMSMVDSGKILEIRVGSHLYGLNRPESDEDFCGAFIAPITYYFGLDKVEEVDLSVTSKLENGRNASDAIDRKFYEFRKYVKLAMECNPNIIEQLFVTEQNILFINEIGRGLLDKRHLFLHKGLKDRFIGYAISQKKKMYVKRDNMKDIEVGIEVLKTFKPKVYVAEFLQDILYHSRQPVFKDSGNQHIQCGDISIQKNITIERAIEQLEQRKSKFSGRKEMVDEFGYDTKFAMHLIRLLLEGKELLETGDLSFPLKDGELLRSIRNGKYSLEEVDKLASDLEDEINQSSLIKSNLPSKPRYNEFNLYLTNTLNNYFWKGKL